VRLERAETQWVLHLEGECSMASAAELRGLLREGLHSAPELVVDLEAVARIDVALLQLLWSAEREAGERGRKFLSRVPEALAQEAREAGFDRFPGAAAMAGQG
jgi:anti-anti-sigma regulatory factor